ncbi:methionyl-tRNA formyltransferase [Elizabethkingia bruuniana]|uniref:Methionyl-tRNA formyltransferase n=1 Tax=Elizabethkingia bruuniana TaxID=1756149 RepID=A0A7T7V1F2_9FLAO|nr:methionyl-tRNA formyltransferase [Elizabethkingia bruuniana]KGO10342.1 methionyl-tRNA formyltransferase [Elizabethkingia miricola]AQX86249.1 methionyl-tRNA formyltransferase [Elizabethkingia bruuniana]KUY24761.1 methionyl-tRNA formyltransferase [Elizabethkingia bruuniana]OPB61815.1 methionyl-tRNA formyltransferase [Elizabethkingia bruuniana]QDZ64438.1 methionyl-tRNA formyltransferase [Elizabethkingia bruuniana]
MNKLKVVFFGTPDFARASLEAIHNSNHEVVGVVTVADKASGRGQKINESPVKKYAVEHQLAVFQPEKLRNPEFLKEIENLNADIFVVVAFRMMPKVLFSMPRLGTFNLHGSLLPDYRGAAPINYAVINGEKKTGVTSFFINEKIDEGHILLQEETDVPLDEDAGQLHDRLMDIGAGLVVKTLDGLAEGIIEEKPQPQVENPKTAYKIFKEDTRINWEYDVEVVYNFIRGMSPYPAAFTTIEISGQPKTLKIFKGKFEKKQHDKSAGQIEIDKNSFTIYTHDGIYYPEELQLEGKKRMTLKDFLNGFQSFADIEIV